MKKIIFVFIFIFILTACNTSRSNVTDNSFDFIDKEFEDGLSWGMSIEDAFSPQDIYDLADVQLIMGQNSYSILDKGDLTEIEDMFSNAEEIKFATGCPFNAVLKMTRTDGTEGLVILASDSCAVYKSNDVYYDYSDGDNSKFLSMFGIDVNTLRAD